MDPGNVLRSEMGQEPRRGNREGETTNDVLLHGKARQAWGIKDSKKKQSRKNIQEDNSLESGKDKQGATEQEKRGTNYKNSDRSRPDLSRTKLKVNAGIS